MNKKLIILLGIGIILFSTMTTLLLIDKVSYIDNFIYNIIIFFKNSNVTDLIKFITFFGSTIGITSILVLNLIFSKKKLNVILNGLFAIICLIINSSVKFIFGRSRPTGINIISERYSSFPSGHSMVSLAVYGLMIYMLWNNKKINKYVKVVYTFILSLLIILIGISRIYLGVHYASDVIAGFGLGMISLSVYIPIIRDKIKH